MTLTKALPARVKAITEDQASEGIFEAIVSAFGNIDSYGDKVLPGAFTDTLADWKASGSPIPVIWAHMSQDPDMHIGFVEKAEERAEGLWIQGRIDLDSPKAAQVFKLLKGKRVTQFSFAYDVQDGAFVKSEDEGEHYELRKLKLYEVGPCLIGVNQETELLAVKAARALETAESTLAEVKAGRTLSAKNESAIRAAHEALGAVLATLGDDDGKAIAPEPRKPEEPTTAKGEDATRDATARTDRLGLLELEIALA